MVVSAPITTDMAVPPNDFLKEATNAEPEENVGGSTSTSSSSPGESIAAAPSPLAGGGFALTGDGGGAGGSARACMRACGKRGQREAASRTCGGSFAAHGPAQPPAPAGGGGSGGAGGSARAQLAAAGAAAAGSPGGGDARPCAEGAVDPRSTAAAAWREGGGRRQR